MYKEVEGCLIELALTGSFDVIAHGCNCFCVQKAGIAKQISIVFNTNDYHMESTMYKGDINKLGQLEHVTDYLENSEGYTTDKILTVVNAYTQYKSGANLDYEALILCLRKMNHIFKGKHIGLPQIGAGIAGGDWNFIKMLIQQELKDCDITVVIYNK